MPLDHFGAARKVFGRLATSVVFNPAAKAIVASNNKNASGKVISVSVPMEPNTTFGPRVSQAMLSMREQLKSAKA